MAKKYLLGLLLAVPLACVSMDQRFDGESAGKSGSGLPAPDRTGPLVYSQQVYALVSAVRADLPHEAIETLPDVLQEWLKPVRDAHRLFTPEGLFCVPCTTKVYEEGPQGDVRFEDCFMPHLSHAVRREHGIPDCVLDRLALSAPIVAEALFELLKRDNREQLLDEDKVKLQLAAKSFYLNNMPMVIFLYRLGVIPDEWVRDFQDRYLSIR